MIKKYYRLKGKDPLEGIYNDAFFNIADQEFVLLDSAIIFAEIINNFYHPKSVVDIGCGIGLYLRELNKLGIAIFGVDGSPAAGRNLVIDKSRFLVQDATKDFFLPQKFDCVICFEVAEHIPTNASRVLVHNITKMSNLVFFTGAPPGQGGHDHINEQSAEFWIALFNAKGYRWLEEDTKKLKKILSERGVVFWLANNLLVFKKDEKDS